MANSLITKSPAATTANRPKLVRDPLIRAGSKVLFDFSDARCHPNGVITPGVVAPGAVFSSLDEVPVTATVLAGGTITVNASGALTFSGGGGSQSGLRIGADKAFDMSPAEYERLMWIWLKLPTVGYTTADYSAVMQITPGNDNQSQGTINLGIGGRNPRFSLGNTAGNGSASAFVANAELPLGVPLQLAGNFDPGQRQQLMVNGAVTATRDTTQTDVFATSAALYLTVPNIAASTIYRLGVCDIDASIAAETGYGFATADILTAAQMMAADYQWGTGVLPGAPRAALS